MIIQYIKHFSVHLQRQMEYKIYGHGGKPVIFFPCQGGRFYDFENFHMVDHWARWIEAGECIVFAADCIDNEAWANQELPYRQRLENHEKWYHYIVDELVPAIVAVCGRKDILTFGCSMGAMHAANLFFRRPDLFDTVIALSGVYHAKFFFNDYMDDLVYANSPENFLRDMPSDHPWMNYYRNNKAIICVGHGRWEEPMLESIANLENIMREKGVNNIWFDHWGNDVDHDWPWWRVQIPYFLGKLL